MLSRGQLNNLSIGYARVIGTNGEYIMTMTA